MLLKETLCAEEQVYAETRKFILDPS